MSTVDQELIVKTKTALSNVIKKPVATDKLLQRPPFKFIQDVILAINKTTGFMKGVYTADESSADAAKDRDAKIAFLQKAIDFFEENLGETLDVKASKIVAGLEVDKTNLFLTKLAEAAVSKADSSAAASTKETKRGKSPSNATRKVGSGTKKKDVSPTELVRKVSPNVKSSEAKGRNTSASASNNAENAGRGKKKASPEAAQSARKASLVNEEVAEDKEEASIPLELDRVNAVPELTVRPPTAARPTTARAPPPRTAKKLDADDAISVMAAQEEQIRLKSGKGMKNLIIEPELTSGQSQNMETGDDQLFVVDDGSSRFDDENMPYLDMKRSENDDLLSSKGSLTKQLADAQTQLASDQSDQQVLDDENVSNRALVSFNEEKLRQNLQKLTRITNPFGRLLDALQEDVDFMFTEYKSWLEEYKRNSSLLESEMSSKDSSLEKLQNQLDVVEKSINDQLELIASVKGSIELKDDKLRRMISLAVSNKN